MCITGEREVVSFVNGPLCREAAAASPGYLILRNHMEILGVHVGQEFLLKGSALEVNTDGT